MRIKKTALTAASVIIILAGLIWGYTYIYFGEYLGSIPPLAYSVVTFFSIILYAVTHNYYRFRFIQLLILLILPFLMLLALGGFVNSSAVIVWSFLSPMGALIFGELRWARRWFIAFMVLLVAGFIVEPYLRPSNNLPTWLINVYFVMNIGAIATLTFVLFFYFISQKNEALRLLHLEQERTDALLLNVLPKQIAAILKHENRLIADHFDTTSILFADVVGFTPLSAELAPAEMVELLNEVFSYFDSLVEKYGLEKIRTIGDNYMVGSGVPNPRPDHAHALVHMALEMLAYTNPEGQEYEDDGSNGSDSARSRLQFRIGINSGPVVAGVIGRQKFHYDLWGDPVNVASRMESHGTPGKIQITRETYELIKDDFICSSRGTVYVKGKGEMETWYVIRPKDRFSVIGS
jgi:guanylate cyclase